MSRGFALSIDALLAVVIAGIFVLTIAFLSGNAKESPYPKLIMKKQANDVLIVLDKTGELALSNSTVLNTSVNQLLPSSLTWKMNVYYYNYSSGFNPANNLTLGSNYSSDDTIVGAQREFVTFSNSSVEYYGIAELVVWLE